MGRTIYFLSLGCPKNRVDTEVLLGQADEAGYRIVEEPAEAEVVVVNTCSFIEDAREESVEAILDLAELKQQGACQKLIVAGCLPQRYPAELEEELPEVDHFLGTGQLPAFRRLLLGEATPRNLTQGTPGWLYDHTSPRLRSTPFYTAYVKIAEGCDQQCAFCVIPSLRGPQRSRSIDSVVEEVRQLAADGVVEVNLIAQALNRYGLDLSTKSGETPDLASLLAALEEVEPGPRWIRLLYLYPRGLSDPLLQQIATSRRIVPYLDLPLQHVSSPILRAMGRHNTPAGLRELLARLRETIPRLALRTTFLVGFPGETEEHFQQLADFVQQQQFDHLGVFRYSPEEGTPALTLPHPVPPDVAAARQQHLYEIQAQISRQKLERLLGQTIDVLVEGISEESELLLQGRSATQAPEIDGLVYITEGEASPGEIVSVRIDQIGDHDLAGPIVSPHHSTSHHR